jgi:hypothetical protein
MRTRATGSAANISRVVLDPWLIIVSAEELSRSDGWVMPGASSVQRPFTFSNELDFVSARGEARLFQAESSS